MDTANPAAPRERQLGAFGIGPVRDDQSGELPPVGGRPFGVDAEAGDLRAEDAGLDSLGEGKAREAELHGIQEMIRAGDDGEHQDERHTGGGGGESSDRAIEHQEIHTRSSKGGELRVGREAADPDEEPEKERNRQRKDHDVRKR